MSGALGWVIGLMRTIHPAPTAAVLSLTAALGAILLVQTGQPLDANWLLAVAAVLGSQIFIGVTNDLVDRERDARIRPDKPLAAGEVSPSAALWLAAAGLALQVVASLKLGLLPLTLGLVATGSALGYNLFLSRTPLSWLPYVVSFGILPAFIATAVGVPVERVLPALPLVAPFVVAAHLANTLRDYEADASIGARNLAQVLGRRRTRLLTLALVIAVGIGAAIGAALSAGLGLPTIGLGSVGIAAVVIGSRSEQGLWIGMMVAAVAWTAAWALGTA